MLNVLNENVESVQLAYVLISFFSIYIKCGEYDLIV